MRQEQVVPTLQQFTDQSTQMSRLQILLGGLPKLEIPLAMSLAMSLAMREFTAFSKLPPGKNHLVLHCGIPSRRLGGF